MKIQQSLEELKLQIQQLEEQISVLQNQIDQDQVLQWRELLKKVDEAIGFLMQIEQVIGELATKKKELQKLKEQEKILKDLYTVLSKELMVVVLDRFLPALENSINVLLSQVVDFELRFLMKETSSGEQQLDIKIEDWR